MLGCVQSAQAHLWSTTSTNKRNLTQREGEALPPNICFTQISNPVSILQSHAWKGISRRMYFFSCGRTKQAWTYARAHTCTHACTHVPPTILITNHSIIFWSYDRKCSQLHALSVECFRNPGLCLNAQGFCILERPDFEGPRVRLLALTLNYSECSITPALWNMMPSSDLRAIWTHVAHMHTHINRRKIIFKNFKCVYYLPPSLEYLDQNCHPPVFLLGPDKSWWLLLLMSYHWKARQNILHDVQQCVPPEALAASQVTGIGSLWLPLECMSLSGHHWQLCFSFSQDQQTIQASPMGLAWNRFVNSELSRKSHMSWCNMNRPQSGRRELKNCLTITMSPTTKLAKANDFMNILH